MAELLKEFRSIDFINYVGVEDFSDQLNFLYTSMLLTTFAALTSLRTYFLHPLSCFIPNSFSSSVDSEYDYVNNYCWTEGTYAVPVSEFKIDGAAENAGLDLYADKKIVYYQWVPFVLALQAVFFYLPRLLWHLVSFDRAGTDVGHIVKVASDAVNDDGEKHERLVSHACRMINQLLEGNSNKAEVAVAKENDAKQKQSSETSMTRFQRVRVRARRRFAMVLPSRFTGNWLILTYFGIKIVYLVNVILQLVLMQKFLQLEKAQYSLLGANLLLDIVKGHDWEQTMTFPRVGSCAVYFRTGANGNWQYSQCTLPINMINEKLYIFLWFWLFFVAITTAGSTVAWIVRVTRASLSNRFVNRLFKLADNYAEIKKNQHFKDFGRQFLKRDGTFILKMIALNSGDIICSEIVHQLWKMYHDKLKGNHESNCSDALLRLEGCENYSCDHVHPRRRSLIGRMRWKPGAKSNFYSPESAAAALAGTGAQQDATEQYKVEPTAPIVEEGHHDDSNSDSDDNNCDSDGASNYFEVTATACVQMDSENEEHHSTDGLKKSFG